jgi:SAM-dependent methyltransferase
MSTKPGTIIEESLRTRILGSHFARAQYGVLLDLGCGTRPYRKLYAPACEKSIGADMPGSYFEKRDVDLTCTVYEIPLDKESVDAILLSEVLHDIQEPDRMFKELDRVMKPGGTLIMTSPFMVPICDGTLDHYRYTIHGLRYLVAGHGFRVDSITPVSGLVGSTIQLGLRPYLRFWNIMAKRTRVRLLYSWINPFMLIPVYLPQWIYLLCYRLTANGWLSRVRRKLEYGCIGYVTIATKI